MLDSTPINYEVDKMAEGYYQAILQGISLSIIFLCFHLVLKSNLFLSL